MMKCHKKRGYTLIELVLVIVILAIIVGSGGDMLIQAFKASFVSRDLTKANWQGRVGMERMIRDIQFANSASNITTGGSGSTITIIDLDSNSISYSLSGTNLMRNSDILSTGITNLSFALYDQAGALIASTSSSSTKYVKVTFTVTMGGTNVTLTTTIYPLSFMQ